MVGLAPLMGMPLMGDPAGFPFGPQPPAPPTAFEFTVSGAGVSLIFAEFFLDVCRTDAPVCLRTN